MNRKRGSNKLTGGGAIFLTILGLPFLAAGCLLFYLVASLCVLAAEAAKWVPVEARIISVDLRRNSDGEGTGFSFAVQCRYEYSYLGVVHLGERVGLYAGSDSVGSWQRNTYNRLKTAFDQDKTVPCYVDPKQPDLSILDRGPRWGHVAMLLAVRAALNVAG